MNRVLATGLTGLLLACMYGGSAQAAIQLPVNYAQQQSNRLAAKLCTSVRDCELAEVTQCVRSARTRVDCAVVWTDSSTNAGCAYKVINVLRGTTFRQRTTPSVCVNDATAMVFRITG